MATRRQEKVARQIQRAVGEGIAGHLADPRIEGLVSITRVEVAADLRVADVYVSILAKDTATEGRTFAAIEHARSRLQAWVANVIRGRFCPILRLHRDDQFKKTIEVMSLIDRLADERQSRSVGPAEETGGQGAPANANEGADEGQ
ncbi:MAG: 30S ribosome-binding factor RbfA [Phycisphaerae bacterium]|nr:30S ribosome-binding factor RbfA [Phycisphaerae bacterium]